MKRKSDVYNLLGIRRESESQRVLYQKTGNDENYTPSYAIEPLLEFIPKDKVIWCPFDKEESEFVQVFKREDLRVIYSHIDNGQDFFEWQPKEEWDIIISNPPFSNKKKFFERTISFGKSFALLMTIVWLNDKAPKEIFFEKGKQLQLLMFDKRIRFRNPYKRRNDKITFSSAYYCWNFLPKDLMYRKLNDRKESI